MYQVYLPGRARVEPRKRSLSKKSAENDGRELRNAKRREAFWRGEAKAQRRQSGDFKDLWQRAEDANQKLRRDVMGLQSILSEKQSKLDAFALLQSTENKLQVDLFNIY